MNNIEEEIKKLDERITRLEKKEKKRVLNNRISFIITIVFTLLVICFIVVYFKNIVSILI